jgi:hypothetical protein
MNCKICGSRTSNLFTAKVLHKYDVDYFLCPACEFVQTENPYWLEEAYASPMNLSDTGILVRNLSYSRVTALLLLLIYGKDKKYLDFAGGYGVFTRLMRDLGFDFYWYDPFTTNLLSKGFEYRTDTQGSITLLTTFESFEHFADPLAEVRKMLTIAPNIIFSTQLVPDPIPSPDQWWYYSPEHGQHVAFYRRKTLQHIASQFNLHLYSIRSFHLLSTKRINPLLFSLLAVISKTPAFDLIKVFLRSKTEEDSRQLIHQNQSSEA